MQVTIPHKFSSVADAKARVMLALNDARVKIGDQATIEKEEWDGNTLTFAFSAQGQNISGTFEVREHDFNLDAKLPMMLRMFEGKIKTAIEEQASTMLK